MHVWGVEEHAARPGGGLWGGQNGKKMVSMRIFFEGLGAKFRRARQCDGRGTPDIQAPDLEFSGVPATEIAHFRLIS
jgi:hypothetical protein